ncbi:MAG: terminase family protein [Hyphomonas sp.]
MRKGKTDSLSEQEMRAIGHMPWVIEARPAQLMPEGDWRTWLFSGGRGAGKTRAGAEWVRWAALFAGHSRIALVGPTLLDVREVMIEGESGLVRIETDRMRRPVFQPSRRRLVFHNGAVAQIFSAEDPDSLRGPQFEAAWCDEAAAWTYGDRTWDMLQMGLRLGANPVALVTTTPRPTPLIRRLVRAPDTVGTLSRTEDNAGNLAPSFIAAMRAAYGGTALGRQELDGVLLDDPEGVVRQGAGLIRCGWCWRRRWRMSWSRSTRRRPAGPARMPVASSRRARPGRRPMCWAMRRHGAGHSTGRAGSWRWCASPARAK